jgi:hypothetical protein|tara:strand:- start:157 stop:438 length:282 start_codon:yes stop_codon:yes gene_type:complete
MELFFDILVKFGLPVAAAVTMGIFIYVILTYILAGVVGQVKSITGIIASLDNRIKTMNHDMIKLDLLVSHALGLKPDMDRLSRSDGKEDARKD